LEERPTRPPLDSLTPILYRELRKRAAIVIGLQDALGELARIEDFPFTAP
jgi:hypothetical protein